MIRVSFHPPGVIQARFLVEFTCKTKFLLRALLRRVNRCRVSVDGCEVGKIGTGLHILLGIHSDDCEDDSKWIIKKVLGARLFENEHGLKKIPISSKMGILVISQFTLFGNLKKGFSPTFHRAAPPSLAEKKYNDFIRILQSSHSGSVQQGVFGEEMLIDSEDSGPVSLWLDSKVKNY